MAANKENVVNAIREAFRGATLGSGVGLFEGQAIDDYESDAERAQQRERDEKQDWGRIPVDALNRCSSSLSFFDPEGMRFHLPAFLIAELNGNFDGDCVFYLTSDYSQRKMAALSPEQRSAVRAFLLFVRDDPNYEFDRPRIEQALSDFWTE